jgi:hypothetical protein
MPNVHRDWLDEIDTPKMHSHNRKWSHGGLDQTANLSALRAPNLFTPSLSLATLHPDDQLLSSVSLS